jgi:putative tricarboxylic transport membrane protein
VPRDYQKPDWRSGFFFFLLGVVVCYFSSRIGLGKPSHPGPGFMPFLAGLLLAFLSLVLLLQVAFGRMVQSWPITFRVKNIAVILAAMAAYGFLLDRIGFLFITFLFVTFLIRVIEPRSWVKSIMAGACSAVASYLLFEILLKSQLPRSPLGIF